MRRRAAPAARTVGLAFAAAREAGMAVFPEAREAGKADPRHG